MTQLFRLALCCALVVGPQFFLQLGAWGWMLASYSQDADLGKAFAETFSGERPCELCEIIESSREQDRPDNRATAQAEHFRLLIPSAPSILPPAPPETRRPILRKRVSLAPPGRNVPTPPPRTAA